MLRHTRTLFAAALFVPIGALAAARTDTRTVPCTALQALVGRSGTVELASSDTAYEAVYRDGGACRQDETAAPAYAPTADRAACFAGWRCKQRNGDTPN